MLSGLDDLRDTPEDVADLALGVEDDRTAVRQVGGRTIAHEEVRELRVRDPEHGGAAAVRLPCLAEVGAAAPCDRHREQEILHIVVTILVQFSLY